MKINLTIAFVVAAAVAAFAQPEKRINLYSAYVFDDKFETYNSSTDYYSGKITGGFQWGAGFEVRPNEALGVELIYFHQDSKVPVSYYDLVARTRDFDVGVSNIMLGINKYMKTGKIEPYGGFLLGAAVYTNQHPQPAETTSITKFGLGGRLGVNVWASEKMAVKLQAMLLTSVQGFGGGFYIGTGGASTGVSSYSTITQLSLGGGLSFKIGQ
jgi:hypothetical protein